MNKLLTFAVTALCCVSAHAETHYKPHVAIGARGGVGMSRMSFSPSVPQSWKMGPVLGVSASYAEEKIFGLTGELLFDQRGWRETFDDNPELNYSRTLTYISLPVMTHISFGSSRFKGFVNLGPEFSYMISDKISANFDYNNPTAAGIAKTRRTDQMSMRIKNRFDYGITAGLGAEFWLTPAQSVQLECRFYYGLGNIYGASKADVFGASRSMTLQAAVGYNFRLK